MLDAAGASGGSEELTRALSDAAHEAGTADADAAEAGGFRIVISLAAAIQTLDDSDRMVSAPL